MHAFDFLKGSPKPELHTQNTPVSRSSLAVGPVAAIVVTLAIYFIAQLGAGLLVVFYPSLLGWSEEQVADWLGSSVVGQFAFMMAIQTLTIILLALFLRHRKVSFRQIGWKKPRFIDGAYALTGFAVYFVSYILILATAQQIFPSLDITQEQQLGFSRDIAGPALAFVFISLVLMPPLVEEIITRGFLYTGLRAKLPKIVAALITSVLFAIAHLQWGSGAPLLWVAAIDTFILSLVLVYLREKTDSLMSPIGLHMIKNGIAFAVLFIIT